MLIIHLLVAIGSFVVTGLALFAPSKTRLRLSYSLIGLTLLSGTILVIQTHDALLSACETGLVYLAFALGGVFTANRRLKSIKS